LATSGFISIFLLIWLSLIGPYLPGEWFIAFGLLTVLLCLLILTVLAPVILSGSWQDRILALILTPFPLVILGIPVWAVYRLLLGEE